MKSLYKEVWRLPEKEAWNGILGVQGSRRALSIDFMDKLYDNRDHLGTTEAHITAIILEELKEVIDP